MPIVKQINFKGEVIGDFELSQDVFGAPVHVAAMHQVVVAQLANARVGTHDTRTAVKCAAEATSPGARSTQAEPDQAAHVHRSGLAAEWLTGHTRRTTARR